MHTYAYPKGVLPTPIQLRRHTLSQNFAITPSPLLLAARCSSWQRKLLLQRSPKQHGLKASSASVTASATATAEMETIQDQHLVQQPVVEESTEALLESSTESQNGHQDLQRSGSSTFMASLTIRNFALIEDECVQFQPGLNVITGESGAGKSVLVEAFGQVLGMPASDHCVRPPATTATVEACLHLCASAQAAIPKLLTSLGLPTTEDNVSSQQLMLRREIVRHHDSVRSRCFVNGTATSLRVLREIGAAMVDVNGQNAAGSIRDSATQLALLDRVAGTQAAAAKFGNQLQQVREVEEQLADIATLGDEEERDELQQMIEEVQQSRLESGEERRLRAELRQLDARRASVERAGLFHQAVTGDSGTGGLLEGLSDLEGHVLSILDQEEATDNNDKDDNDADETGGIEDNETLLGLDEAAEALANARALLRKAEGQVAAYARQHRYLQQEYDAALSRLQAVERLLKQYQCSTSEELLLETDNAQADLDKWYQLADKEGELQEQHRVLQQQLQEAALQLSLGRRAGAGKLKAAVEACLTNLAMSGSQFAAEISWQPVQQDQGLLMPEELSSQVNEAGVASYSVQSTGLDHVTFMLAAAPQEPFRPLSGVASGGESARIMLAMKAAPLAVGTGDNGALAESQTSMAPPLMVLDELDSGVGARLGKAVGQLLRSLTANPSVIGSPGQILCVSHLPQVAAYADHHLCVRKAVDSDGRVQTSVDALLDQNDRAHEVAAMLGLDHSQAMQMLEEVRKQYE